MERAEKRPLCRVGRVEKSQILHNMERTIGSFSRCMILALRATRIIPYSIEDYTSIQQFSDSQVSILGLAVSSREAFGLFTYDSRIRFF